MSSVPAQSRTGGFLSSPRVRFYRPEIFAGIALAALILLLAVSPKTSEYFLDSENLLNVTKQVSLNAIMACGMTFAILMGGIDLSVGSIVAITGMFTADALTSGLPVPVAVCLGIFGGSCFGVFNGVIAAYTRVPPFIATLGTMSIARGWALLYRDGYPLSDLPETFNIIGQGSIAGIPTPTVVMIVVILFSWFLLHKTPFGRYVFALGWSNETVRLSGIYVKWVKVRIFTYVSFCAAISGVLLCARLGSAQPLAGSGWELDAIAAVVIGGGNIAGGRATIFGTIIGAFIIGFLGNGLNLFGVSPYIQTIVKGLVILLAVLMRSGFNKEG